MHLLVPQVLVEFGAGVWRMLGNHPQADPWLWTLWELGKQSQFGNPQQLRVLREQQAEWSHQSGGPCRQPGPDFEEMDSWSCQRGQAQTSLPGLCAHEMVWGPQALSKPLGMQRQGLGEP